MSSRTNPDWDRLLAFNNEEEIIEHISSVLSLSIAYEIEQLLLNRKMSKKELAQKIGTSASYITQIMTGDKLVNMKFLAKIKHYLGVDFSIDVLDKFQEKCVITDFSEWLVTDDNRKSVKKTGKQNERKAG